MSDGDKASNKIDDVVGKAKEGLGKATGDDELEEPGQEGPGQERPQAGRREGQGRLQALSLSGHTAGRTTPGPRPGVVLRLSPEARRHARRL